jgi:hypothetical protein
MLSLKKVLTAAALLLLVNACGTTPTENARQVKPTPKTESTPQSPQTETTSGTAGSSDAQAGYVRVDAADGQSAFACSYSINGQTFEGRSQEECERLKKDFEKAAGSTGVPLPPAAPAPSVPAGSDTQVACAFNINGKLYEGKSQAAHRLILVKKTLQAVHTLPDIDKVLLVHLALLRWLIRSQSRELARFVYSEYAILSLRLSGTPDALGIAADLSQKTWQK